MSTTTMTVPESGPPHHDGAESPQAGDLVVARGSEEQGCFTIREVPNTPSMTWESRGRALDVARAFAVSHGVDVWFSEGPVAERLLAYRRR